MKDTFHDLYLAQLEDLYSAERQLIEALPKAAEAASEPRLREAILAHLEETREHASRLESILKGHATQADGVLCETMESLLRGAEIAIRSDLSPDLKDAAIIAAAQRIEHFEIAGYGTCKAWAKQMHEEADAVLLERTLDEESRADAALSNIAIASVNERAMVSHGAE